MRPSPRGDRLAGFTAGRELHPALKNLIIRFSQKRYFCTAPSIHLFTKKSTPYFLSRKKVGKESFHKALGSVSSA